MDSGNKKHIIDYTLIAKYFAEETNVSENKELMSWINENSKNKQLFSQLEIVWKDTGALPTDNEVKELNIDAAWDKIRLSLSKEKKSISIPLQPKPSPFKKWQNIAATLIALLAVGSVLYTISNSTTSADLAVNTIQSGNTKKSIELPDGTLVTLNKNSTLSYSSGFNDQSRNVTLNGEAFFDVTHDPNIPFIIAAQETKIKVLGTTFNVFSNADSVSVYLLSGKVAFSEGDNNLILSPGNTANYSPASLDLTLTQETKQNPLYWKDSKLVYDGTPLNQVINELNDIFNQQITLSNSSLTECPFSATFENENIDVILDIISASFEIEISKEKSIIYLSGNGCSPN